MNLPLFLKLLVIAVACVCLARVVKTNVAACSPENSNIVIVAETQGVISTPEFPDGYPSASCIWKIQAPSDFRLAITIEALKLQGVDDYLVVRDGNSESSPLFGKYGPCASGSITLFFSGRSGFLEAIFPVFRSRNELKITYRTTNPDDIDCTYQAENLPNFCSDNTKLRELSGVISSPNFPINYGENEHCMWTIIAPEGYRVQLIIHWLGIEDHRYSRPNTCGDDMVLISELVGERDSRNVKKLCGCKQLFTHVSFKEKMWLTFSSYKKANWPGFYVTYQALSPEECPANETNCQIKSMPPVGFNAQGQVCTTPVKTSSRVPTSSATPLLLSSSVERLAKTSSQAPEASKSVTTYLLPPSYVESLATETSRQTLDTSKTVTKSSATYLLLPSFVEPLTKTSSQALETSKSVTKPSATSLLSSSYVESLIKTSSQPLETSKSETKSSATSLLLPRFVEFFTKTSSQTLETSKSVTKPSATSLLSSSYVESLIETSSQPLETTKSEKISSATSFLLPSFVEPLTKTSSQTLETSKSVTKPSATSLLSPSVKISFSETSGQLMASITQVTKPLGTFSVIPTIVKSSAKPENYSMEVRIPSSLRTPFVASSYLGSSTRNGFQTLEISRTPSSSSIGAPSLGTLSGESSFKESTLALQSLSTPRELPPETSSSFLHITSVRAGSAGIDSRVQKTSPTRLVVKFSETPFFTSSYVKYSTAKSSRELKTTSQREMLLDSSPRPVKTDSSVQGGKTVEIPSFIESNMFRQVSSTASNITATSAMITTTKHVQTQKITPSAKVTSTFTRKDLQYTTTTPLQISNMGSAADTARSLNLGTKQTNKIVQPTSSVKITLQSIKDVPVSLITGIGDRETIIPGDQIKISRRLSSSVGSTETKGSLISGYKTEGIQPTVSIESYKNTTSVIEVSTAIDLKSDLVQPGISTKSYYFHTSKAMETQEKKTSTATDFKTPILKPNVSISTDSNQRASLVIKSTRPMGTSSSLDEHDVLISQSERLTIFSKSENVRPSKTSETTFNVISSVTETTPVISTTTQAPLVITAEPHSNDTGAIEGRDSPLKGVAVICTHYAMEIIITRILQPHLLINSLHLLDPTCKVFYSNDTYALLRAPLEGCDTEQTTSEDYFIYVNTMMGDAKSSNSSDLITREGRVQFKFQCSYRRIHVLSIVSFSSRRKVVRTSEGDGVGNFTFEMDMFEDPKYDIVVSQYPINVRPDQTMYFQVNVKSRDRRLVAFLEECWVTPTTNPRDQTRYTIIERGCPRDSTLQYLYQKSPEQKFSFQAFRFRQVPSARLYVHCEVVTCRSSDKGSVCDLGCTENRRRRRESPLYIMDKDVFLSLGPVDFQENSAAMSNSSTVYIQALTGTLGVVVLILLIAIVILLLRRRNRPKTAWILLASKSQRTQQEEETSAKLMPQTTEL